MHNFMRLETAFRALKPKNSIHSDIMLFQKTILYAYMSTGNRLIMLNS